MHCKYVAQTPPASVLCMSPDYTVYIRSSPRGPNRDPNRTLSNELLYYVAVYLIIKLLVKYYLYTA